MEWTKRETLKFIGLLHGFPCLWNTKSNDYKNRQKRRDALLELAQKMNLDVSFIEKKMISLRTQYNREILKFKSKPSEAIQSTWYAFDYLNFLKDVNVPRPVTDFLMISQTEANQEAAAANDGSVNTEESNSSTQLKCENKFNSTRKSESQTETSVLKDSSNITVNEQNDEFSIFGEAIANELRGIKSKRHLLTLKKEIMELVFTTKLRMLDAEGDCLSDI